MQVRLGLCVFKDIVIGPRPVIIQQYAERSVLAPRSKNLPRALTVEQLNNKWSGPLSLELSPQTLPRIIPQQTASDGRPVMRNELKKCGFDVHMPDVFKITFHCDRAWARASVFTREKNVEKPNIDTQILVKLSQLNLSRTRCLSTTWKLYVQITF